MAVRFINEVIADLEEGVDLKSIDSYMGFFKHGCPPHGGFGFGNFQMIFKLLFFKKLL